MFGLLLIGYFVTFVVSNLHIAFAFAGCYIMCFALNKLTKYEKSYKYSRNLSVVLGVLYLAETVLSFLKDFEGLEFSKILVSGLDICEILLYSFFHITLLVSSSKICRNVGNHRLSNQAKYEMYIFLIYPAVYLLVYVLRLFSVSKILLNLITALLLIVKIMIPFVVIFLIFAMFRNIVDKEKYEQEKQNDFDSNLK